MSSARFPLTFASVLTTALVAAALGAGSVMWQSANAPTANEPLPRSVAMFTESVDVVAPAEDLAISLRPTHLAQQVGDDLILEARLQNTGAEPLSLSRQGVFDLFVRRTASSLPMSLDDVSFLALCEVVKAQPTVLLPG